MLDTETNFSKLICHVRQLLEGVSHLFSIQSTVLVVISEKPHLCCHFVSFILSNFSTSLPSSAVNCFRFPKSGQVNILVFLSHWWRQVETFTCLCVLFLLSDFPLMFYVHLLDFSFFLFYFLSFLNPDYTVSFVPMMNPSSAPWELISDVLITCRGCAIMWLPVRHQTQYKCVQHLFYRRVGFLTDCRSTF